jgi:sulfite exporter TauE/SafE
MCGPFTLLFKTSFQSMAAYHGARLLSYTLLGGIAGAFGSALLQNFAFLSLPLLGVLLFAVYFSFLAMQIFTNRAWHPPIPTNLSKYILPRAMQSESDLARALWIGFASIFLPCGWLYSFLLGTIASQSASRGAITMAAFWLGTLPALSLSTLAGNYLGRRIVFSARGRALAFMVVGVALIGLRLQSPLHGQNNDSIFCDDSPEKIFNSFKSMVSGKE